MTPVQIFDRARSFNLSSLDEKQGKNILSIYGINVPRSAVVTNDGNIEDAVSKVGLPSVVKVMSSKILHKSDSGGVRVELKTLDEVRNAISDIAAMPAIRNTELEGFLIEEMIPAGQEIVAGGAFDTVFGPILMVGLGGVFVEIMADVAFRICPIERIDAEEMLEELRGIKILDGVRGKRPASREAIIDVLLKLGGEDGILMRHQNDIQEIDINPLIVSETDATAVDALFILKPKS